MFYCIKLRNCVSSASISSKSSASLENWYLDLLNYSFKYLLIYYTYFDISVALNLNDAADRRTSSKMFLLLDIECPFIFFYDKSSIAPYNFAWDTHNYLMNYSNLTNACSFLLLYPIYYFKLVILLFSRWRIMLVSFFTHRTLS